MKFSTLEPRTFLLGLAWRWPAPLVVFVLIVLMGWAMSSWLGHTTYRLSHRLEYDPADWVLKEQERAEKFSALIEALLPTLKRFESQDIPRSDSADTAPVDNFIYQVDAANRVLVFQIESTDPEALRAEGLKIAEAIAQPFERSEANEKIGELQDELETKSAELEKFSGEITDWEEIRGAGIKAVERDQIRDELAGADRMIDQFSDEGKRRRERWEKMRRSFQKTKAGASGTSASVSPGARIADIVLGPVEKRCEEISNRFARLESEKAAYAPVRIEREYLRALGAEDEEGAKKLEELLARERKTLTPLRSVETLSLEFASARRNLQDLNSPTIEAELEPRLRSRILTERVNHLRAWSERLRWEGVKRVLSQRLGTLENELIEYNELVAVAQPLKIRIREIEGELDRIRSAERLDLGELAIDSPPARVMVPERSNRLTILLLFLCGGGALAVTLWFGLEISDSTIRSSAQAEAIFGVKALGVLPTPPRREKMVPDRSGTDVTERFSLIAGRLRFKNSSDGSVFAITSVRGDDGKSMTAANLAFSLARSHLKTLLIVERWMDEEDSRIRALVSEEDDQASGNLMDYLTGKAETPEEVVKHGIVSGVDLILPPDGSAPVQFDENARKRMDQLIEWARSKYGAVTIDAVPLLEEQRACRLDLDGTLWAIAIHCQNTRRADALKGLQTLEKGGGVLAGLVMNHMRPFFMEPEENLHA